MVATNKNAHLTTNQNEYIKSYIVYVGANMSVIYEARANCLDGEPCLKTTYTYVAGTNRVEKTLEEEGAWVSATMDMP